MKNEEEENDSDNKSDTYYMSEIELYQIKKAHDQEARGGWSTQQEVPYEDDKEDTNPNTDHVDDDEKNDHDEDHSMSLP